MDFEYRHDDKHHVVLIEYQDGRPFSVITLCEKYQSPHYWDFDWCERNAMLYFDMSGFGGELRYMIDKRDWEGAEPVELWAENVPFFTYPKKRRVTNRKTLFSRGYILLDEPRQLDSIFGGGPTHNPFDMAVEGDTTECKHCGRVPTESICRHLRWCDECGDYFYIADRSFNFIEQKCEHTDYED